MIQLGLFMIIIGFGSLVLEEMGYEFRILSWASDMQPGIGIAVGIIGVAVIAGALVMKARAAKPKDGGQWPAPQGGPQYGGQPQPGPNTGAQPAWGQPVPQPGAPQTGAQPQAPHPYGGQQPGQQYGAPQPGQPYSAPQPGQQYGGQPQSGPGFGQQPPRN